MNCRDTRARIAEFVVGGLDATTMEGVSAHIASCSECRLELRQLEQTIELLHDVGEVPVPADMVRRVRERIETERTGPAFFELLLRFVLTPQFRAAAAACLVLAVCSYGILHYRGARPDDMPAAKEAAGVDLGGVRSQADLMKPRMAADHAGAEVSQVTGQQAPAAVQRPSLAKEAGSNYRPDQVRHAGDGRAVHDGTRDARLVDGNVRKAAQADGLKRQPSSRELQAGGAMNETPGDRSSVKEEEEQHQAVASLREAKAVLRTKANDDRIAGEFETRASIPAARAAATPVRKSSIADGAEGANAQILVAGSQYRAGQGESLPRPERYVANAESSGAKEKKDLREGVAVQHLTVTVLVSNAVCRADAEAAIARYTSRDAGQAASELGRNRDAYGSAATAGRAVTLRIGSDDFWRIMVEFRRVGVVTERTPSAGVGIGAGALAIAEPVEPSAPMCGCDGGSGEIELTVEIVGSE